MIHYGDLETAQRTWDEYQGTYDSEEDFAYELMNSCYEVPSYLEYYIDYEKFARDLFLCDYLSIEVDGKIHVFSNNF